MTEMLKLCSLCLLVYGTDNRRYGGDSMDFKIRQGESDQKRGRHNTLPFSFM